MKRNRARWLIIVSLGMLLFLFNYLSVYGDTTGDSNDWSTYDHDVAHSCLSPDITLQPPLVQKWKFSSGLADTNYICMHAPIIIGDRIYIDISNQIYALDSANGSPLWYYTGNDLFDNAPAYSDGVIYAGAHDGKLYAVNTAGNLLSMYQTNGWVRGGAAVSNGVVYFTSFDGNLYAATTSSLSPVWSKSIGQGNGIESAPAVVNGVVYVGGGPDVWAINASNGTTIWSQPVDSVSHFHQQ